MGDVMGDVIDARVGPSHGERVAVNSTPWLLQALGSVLWLAPSLTDEDKARGDNYLL